jgi:hypothetical protein
VKITGEKLHGLILAFDFLDHGNNVLSTQQTEISDDVVDKGETPAFQAETLNPPGSIKFRVRAYDTGEKELRVANGGPFIIE